MVVMGELALLFEGVADVLTETVPCNSGGGY